MDESKTKHSLMPPRPWIWQERQSKAIYSHASDPGWSSVAAIFLLTAPVHTHAVYHGWALDQSLTLWRPLLPYGCSYKASCAPRPG